MNIVSLDRTVAIATIKNASSKQYHLDSVEIEKETVNYIKNGGHSRPKHFIRVKGQLLVLLFLFILWRESE